MIPVQDNWMHIKNEFIDSCESDINNIQRFKQLGLFRMLLPTSMGGIDGHLQDLLECQLQLSQHCVDTANKYIRCASAPYLVKQFGDAVFQEVYGQDNDALVLLYPGDIETARTMTVESVYDWIIVQHETDYCLINVANRNFEPERYVLSLEAMYDNKHILSWFQLYNRVLTASSIGSLEHVCRLLMNTAHSDLYAVLGMVLSEADEMKVVLHRNINHALLHIQDGEQIPLYDRTKYKVQSTNSYIKAVKYLKKVVNLTDNTEARSIYAQVNSMDLEHLNNVKEDFKGYIMYLNSNNNSDIYL
tara:strand:+ start:544 stop:1452 length:909 start_codon:yes stop_codon:yes gene_type:complete